MPELPDFLHLDKAAREREENRQDTLRREFNSRARQSGPEIEMARAIIIEPSLRDALNRVTDQAEYAETSNRLADNLSAQGRFLEASETAVDKDIREFNGKAAIAVLEGTECSCPAGIAAVVAGQRIRLPKAHAIKQVYSIPAGVFGYLVECATCHNWTFTTANPAPSGPPVSDLVRLKA